MSKYICLNKKNKKYIYIFKKYGKYGRPSPWRVCYQHGLPHLVYYVSHMTILIDLVFCKFFSDPSSSSSILRKVFNHHEKYLLTKLPGSTDWFPFESNRPLSSTRDREKGTT